MATFQPGDEVQLNSGGPVMTVEKTDDDTIHCIWFTGKATSQQVVRDSFPEVVLNKYELTVGTFVV